MGDDYRRIRYRGRSPARPDGGAGSTAYLGRAEADSLTNGAFTPFRTVTVTGDEAEGATPTLAVGSDTSLAFPLRGKFASGQYVPVGWSGYRWSGPVPGESTPPPEPPSGCPDSDPDHSPYWFRPAIAPECGPYPMHWDESLDAWIGQVDLNGSGEPPAWPIWEADICDYDPNQSYSLDLSGTTTLGVALRRITTPARLTAQISDGRIVGVTIDDPGCGYNYWLNNYSDMWGLKFTGGGGRDAWVVARTDIDADGNTVPYEDYQYGRLASVTIFNGGSGYTSPPAVEAVTPDGWANTRVISYSLWKCTPFGGTYVAHGGTGWVPTPKGSIYANRCDPEFSSFPPDEHAGYYMGWKTFTENCDSPSFRGPVSNTFIIIERDWNIRLQGVATAFSATVTP